MAATIGQRISINNPAGIQDQPQRREKGMTTFDLFALGAFMHLANDKFGYGVFFAVLAMLSLLF